MLHVFHVDLGVIYTFEMELAMESIQVLMSTVASVTGIPEDKQVLLISNGEALDPAERVCSYSSAGTDTNPIFLFSKSTIESSIPPSPSLDLGSEANLKEQVEMSFNLPPTYETLVSRAQLASDFHLLAIEISKSCERLVCEQKLQQKGWAAVVANLESIASEFRARSSSVHQIYSEFLDSRPRYIELLDRFKQMLPLLARVPVLPCLLTRQVVSKERLPDGRLSLLDWISAQDNKNSLQDMVKQCIEAVEQFDESHLTEITGEVNEVLESLDNTNMKEIKGLDERLAGLQQLLHIVQTLTQSQADMAQGFQQNQERAQNIGDPSVLPDLCVSHQKQLMMLMKNHSHLRDVRKRCAKAKDELSSNLHTRLRWIMYVEKKICECDGTIIMYHENIRRIKRRLEIIEQVNDAPRMYILAVAEVVRRRLFSSQFQKWTSKLCETSNQARSEETVRREEFELLFGQHFLQNLFRGFGDRPSKFAEGPPRVFDEQLPIITDRDLQQLQDQIPELATFIENSSINISMRDDTGKKSFLQLGEFENLGTSQFLLGVATRTSESISERKMRSFAEMSVSQKATLMSMDASTQVEWRCQEEKTPVQDEHGVQFYSTADVPVDEPRKVTKKDFQGIAESAEDSGVEGRKKSSSDTGSERSSALDDSDLVFRSAHEDYVTVFDADLVANLDDGNNAQPVGELQVDCTALLDDASQTPTITSSGTQSTDHSSHTEQSSDGNLQIYGSNANELLPKSGSEIREEKMVDWSDQRQAGNQMVQRLEQLEKQLANAQSSLDSEFSQNKRLQQTNAKVIECFKNEIEVFQQGLKECKQVLKEFTSDVKGDVLAVIESVQEKAEFHRIAANRTRDEFEREMTQLNAHFENERTVLLELKSKLELENRKLTEELKQSEADKERSKFQHKEETDKLSLIISDYKAKIEEHEGVAQKIQENKSRFEEDQQIRFNVIMMKLKREKESALSQAQEKIKELTKCVEEQEKHIKCFETEKEKLAKECQQAQEAFCGREQELLNALQENKAKIQEAELLMQDKQAEFLQQIEQEKASTLTLLQVERQMWEVERNKKSAEQDQETERGTDAVLEEDFQQKIQVLENENRKFKAILSEQSGDETGRSVLQSAELKQALNEKEQQIRILQQQLTQMQQLAGAATATTKSDKALDKISLKDFQTGDVILLKFDNTYENYLVVTTGQTLFFLHPDSLDQLDLAMSGPKKRQWMLAQMTDKEYVQAKKPHNRFHVPVGTKFYRIHAKPCAQ